MLRSGPRVLGDARPGPAPNVLQMATRREIALARHLRRNATPAEQAAWELLRDRRCAGVKFKRQYPIADFIVDFYAPQLKLVIELDGSIHREPEHATRDAIRTSEIEALGVTVVRIANEDVNALTLSRLVEGQMKPPPRRRVSDGEGAGG